MGYFSQSNKGMTFIEVLVALGVISILFTSFFYIWNSIDIFRKSRDAKRINDLQLLDTALKTILSTENSINLGQENIIYTSLPDSSSTCGNYNLVSVFSPYSYRCQVSGNYLNVDGSGWLPVNLNLGKILTVSVLPVDPLNNKDYFYAYQVKQGRYKFTARFESPENISKMISDGGFELTLYEVGSDLFIPSPHSGLVGYWTFDEGTGTIAYDLSGYGNNGSLYNFNWTATSGWTTGKISGALNFDGVDDRVDCGNGTSLNIANGITIEAWVNTNSYGSYKKILIKGNNINFAFALSQGPSPYETYFIVQNSGGSKGSAIYNQNLPVGQWVHLVGTYDNYNVKLYWNGLKVASASLSGNINSNNESVNISGYAAGTEIFNGLIDEVHIYNRALSDAEIQAIYNATK